jgi:hypothetical protein
MTDWIKLTGDVQYRNEAALAGILEVSPDAIPAASRQDLTDGVEVFARLPGSRQSVDVKLVIIDKEQHNLVLSKTDYAAVGADSAPAPKNETDGVEVRRLAARDRTRLAIKPWAGFLWTCIIALAVATPVLFFPAPDSPSRPVQSLRHDLRELSADATLSASARSLVARAQENLDPTSEEAARIENERRNHKIAEWVAGVAVLIAAVVAAVPGLRRRVRWANRQAA